MRSATLSLILATAVSMSATAAAGADDANTHAFPIEGLHNEKSSGLYDRIISKAAEHGSEVKTDLVAPNRAFTEFSSKDVPCLVPANTNDFFYDYGDGVVQSDPMFIAKIYIFTPRGSEPITDVDKLKGKTVGIRPGIEYGQRPWRF